MTFLLATILFGLCMNLAIALHELGKAAKGQGYIPILRLLISGVGIPLTLYLVWFWETVGA